MEKKKKNVFFYFLHFFWFFKKKIHFLKKYDSRFSVFRAKYCVATFNFRIFAHIYSIYRCVEKSENLRILLQLVGKNAERKFFKIFFSYRSQSKVVMRGCKRKKNVFLFFLHFFWFFLKKFHFLKKYD